MADPHEYVLGTQADELERLGFQHRLWSDAAHTLWKLARIRPGERVLDVGCGPGFAAFDLAQIVGARGAVVGVDESPGFVAELEHGAAARGLPWCAGVVRDVHALGDLGTFDLAWARWVLCFAADPERVVAEVARALRPGGRFCVHDYFNYTTMTLAPRRESYTTIVQATARSWRAHGGDPDVMGRLPGMLRRHGMRLEHVTVHQRVARPADTMWLWGETWWRNYVPRLAQMGEITEAQAAQFFADFDEAKAADDLLVLPPVYEMLAVREG